MGPSRTPTSCVCGANFTVEHVLSCPHGGFPSIRHNEIRDITANLLTEVCNDVCVKTDLQEITTEELSGRLGITTEGARLDILPMVFGVEDSSGPSWTSGCSMHHLIRSYTTIKKCFRKHNLEKKRAYDQRDRTHIIYTSS